MAKKSKKAKKSKAKSKKPGQSQARKKAKARKSAKKAAPKKAEKAKKAVAKKKPAAKAAAPKPAAPASEPTSTLGSMASSIGSMLPFSSGSNNWWRQDLSLRGSINSQARVLPRREVAPGLARSLLRPVPRDSPGRQRKPKNVVVANFCSEMKACEISPLLREAVRAARGL